MQRCSHTRRAAGRERSRKFGWVIWRLGLMERIFGCAQKNTKARRHREPALNDLGAWAVNQLLTRARLLGATEPGHYLLPADLSKHTKHADPLKGGKGYDPTRHQSSWDSAWENLKKAAGLPDLRFHDLRHTHITHAVESGVPIEVVMAQVGHLSAEMTRHYTHLGSKATHSAVAAVQRRSPATLAVLGIKISESGVTDKSAGPPSVTALSE